MIHDSGKEKFLLSEKITALGLENLPILQKEISES
jgi:hypothetical protein